MDEDTRDLPERLQVSALVEYELTTLGRSLLDSIKQFLSWTLDAFPEIKRAREAFDRSTGRSSRG